MSQRVISATESLGKAMGFRVSPEGLCGTVLVSHCEARKAWWNMV